MDLATLIGLLSGVFLIGWALIIGGHHSLIMISTQY